MTKPVDPKKAMGAKKLALNAVPFTLQVMASQAANDGAFKYGIHNYIDEDKQLIMSTYINAIKRHLTLFEAGQDYTSDTDVHNLSAIVTTCAIIFDCIKVNNNMLDDRVKLSEEALARLEALINQETK